MAMIGTLAPPLQQSPAEAMGGFIRSRMVPTAERYLASSRGGTRAEA